MDIASIANSIEEATAALSGDNVPPEPERQRLLGAMEKLSTQLKKPAELILEMSTATFKPAIVRLAVEMKLFEIAARAPNQTISLDDLAEEAKVDSLLLLRVLRVLSSMNLFTEQSNQSYNLTPFGARLQPGTPYHSWILIDDTNQQSIAKATSYFTNNGFTNPTNPRNTLFNHAYNTEQTFFEWLCTQPHLGTAFNHVMQFAKMLRGPDWYEFFPVAEKLFSHGSDIKITPTIIDIGGGTGRDLTNFKNHHATYPGRLILQDLPEVLADADKDALAASGIEAVPHSFLTLQPAALHGATAYIIKNCLHDWPDAEAQKILGHIAAAMSKDSRLLVCETSLTEQGVPFMNAVFDWVMMVQFAGLDRMESQWRALFEKVGLRIRHIHKSPVAQFTVVFELEKIEA